MYSQLSELDRKLLRMLVSTGGEISTNELSQQLAIPSGTVQRRRKKHYDLISNIGQLDRRSFVPMRFQPLTPLFQG